MFMARARTGSCRSAIAIGRADEAPAAGGDMREVEHMRRGGPLGSGEPLVPYTTNTSYQCFHHWMVIALRYMICEDNPPKIPTKALLYAFGASEIEARALAKVTKTPSGNLAHFLPRSAKQKRRQSSLLCSNHMLFRGWQQ